MGDGDVAVKRGQTGFGYYEEDVIAEILARVPVKSVMRFRCVCKSWRALISESYFVKKQLSFVERGITESPHRLIINLDPHPLALDCNALKTVEDYEALVPIKSDDVRGQFAITPLDFPLKKTGCEIGYRILVGSCNGLLCVEVNEENIILWNPCTRDFTVLPYPPLINSNFSSYYLYGFGYDSANDDYKVIWGLSCYSNGAEEITMHHIFSLKTRSWRTVKDIESVGLMSSLRGLFVNGALHWLYHLSVGGSRILSFDLGEEKFQKAIPLPYDGLFSEPFIHRNCLCVGNYLLTETKSINIWMMKEYGVKESWTQVLQFSLENLVPDCFTNCIRPRTVCILENGLVLINSMFDFEQLGVFSNFKEKTFTRLVEVDKEDDFDTTIYLETLVPPRLPTRLMIVPVARSMLQ